MKPFAVEVLCPEISEALQRAAFAAGYRWSLEVRTPLHTTKPYLFIGEASTMFPWYMGVADRHFPQWELVSIPEAFRRLREQITPPKPKTKTVTLENYVRAYTDHRFFSDVAAALTLTPGELCRVQAEFSRQIAAKLGITEVEIPADTEGE